MLSIDRVKDHAKRILSIPSNAESGNEELARYFQSIMHDVGMQTQMQSVGHSQERLSKRQVNLIGFTSDVLVDRSTRRGTLFINPTDVSTGNIKHLWSATQGNPNAPVVTDMGIIGAGAAQGKLDFLCRVLAAAELVDKKHKSPLYLVGTCGSHQGMMGSRFLIESLAVNPKNVFSFAPTEMKICAQAPGQFSMSIQLEANSKDRDPRGYNRAIDITAFGLSVDHSNPQNAINAFDLLLDLLLDATEKGFDYQWSNLEAIGAQGANPDIARAQVYLTAFQFEDFKQFLRNKTGTEEQQRFFRVEFPASNDLGTRFISTELVEVILELDFEWKQFVKALNKAPGQGFQFPYSVGTLSEVSQKPGGKMALRFELRYLPEHSNANLELAWKERVTEVSAKYSRVHFQVSRDYSVPPVLSDGNLNTLSSNYLSDAGFFAQKKFSVSILGLGSSQNLPKGPNEAVSWTDLQNAIEIYKDLMSVSIQS